MSYSLLARKAERALLPYAQQEGRLIIAYSPLAQGFLSGKYGPDRLPHGVMRRANPIFWPENLERAAGLLQSLRNVAAHHGATPSQMALAWVIRRPGVIAIPGASSVAQLESNAAAADLDLTDEEDAELTEAADEFRPVGALGALPGLVSGLLRR